MATSGLEAAFEAVQRADFLPRRDRRSAHWDRPIQIGHGQTNSQPRTVFDMLRLLEVRRGDRVLDVGAGSGWTTALLGHLVGPTGAVVGVELEPELARWGAENLSGYAMSWASIRTASEGVLGVPEEAPYDRILVSATARELPEELVAQLSEDSGRMVIPVRSTMLLVVRDGERTRTSRHGSYSFVPLR